MPNPTNADIFRELGEIKEIAIATREQATKTNDRVHKLEIWQAQVNERSKQTIKRAWYDTPMGQRIFWGVSLILTAVAMFIAVKGGFNVPLN